MYKSLKSLAQTFESAQKTQDLIDDYVESNDKALIPKLLEAIHNDDELYTANQTAKESCTLLYRGLALDKSLTNEEIIEYDAKQSFIATSRSEQIAKDYAKGKSQIDGKDAVKPEYSVVLVYDVAADTDAVAFDSMIFEKEHARLETVITAKTAKLVRIDNILVDNDAEE